MIKHIVMWKLAGSTELWCSQAAQRVKAAFEGLRGRILGMSSLKGMAGNWDLDNKRSAPCRPLPLQF